MSIPPENEITRLLAIAFGGVVDDLRIVGNLGLGPDDPPHAAERNAISGLGAVGLRTGRRECGADKRDDESLCRRVVGGQQHKGADENESFH
jgi:hypothetical protein